MSIGTSQNYESSGICIRCFGRSFARIGTGITNTERGETFYPEKEQLFTNAGYHVTDEGSCQICNGVFARFEDFYEEMTLETDGIEYNSFLIGSRFPAKSVELEEKLQNLLGDTGETIKREFNREFGKYVSDRNGKEADFNEPDLNVVVDLNYDTFKIKTRNLFIYGIYRKKRRDIPQTRWIHKKDIEESIETIIGDRLNELTKGKNFFLHGAGREDVDVQMLGNGREFIIESQEPRIRSINLNQLMESINISGQRVEVSEMQFVQKSMVADLKSKSPDKSYRVRVHSENPIDAAKFRSASEKLSGKHIYQRTPLRVSTRRSDLIRDKQVREVTVEEVSTDVAEITVRAEAGTYIKELIHGDNGRTTPSLAETYGEKLSVETLDVIWIHRNGE